MLEDECDGVVDDDVALCVCVVESVAVVADGDDVGVNVLFLCV